MDENLNLYQLLTSPVLIQEKDLCKIKFYQPGDKLFEEDDPPAGIFLIKNGLIEITKNIQENKKISFFTLEKNDVAGEIFFGKNIKKNFVNAEVMNKAIVIFYEGKKLEEFLSMNMHLALPIYIEITKIISARLRQINNNFKDFFIKSLKNK